MPSLLHPRLVRQHLTNLALPGAAGASLPGVTFQPADDRFAVDLPQSPEVGDGEGQVAADRSAGLRPA